MSVATDLAAAPRPAVRVARWPSERPLFVLVLAVSLLLWVLIAVSIFGAIYAVFIVAFLFIAHVVAVVHIRGSGVKLGEDQLPELHRRVLELAAAAEMPRVPDAYVMQEGGALNAFATKFLGSRLIVLYSDLLEACDDDEGARDMVIGHELGHVLCRHLDWMWLTAPARVIPFLGAAYSRACERTCDRWGAALCGDRAAAMRGLVLLAAGGKLARRVDLEAFTRQQRDLDTGWMTIGRWLSGYPTLCERVAALDQELASQAVPAGRGPLRALAILVGGVVLVGLSGIGVTAVFMIPALSGALEMANPDVYEDDFAEPVGAAAVEEATIAAQADLERLGVLALEWTVEVGVPPEEVDELEELWMERFGPEEFPRDPFDGRYYGFFADDSSIYLWSSGPDGLGSTDDDIDHIVDWAE